MLLAGVVLPLLLVGAIAEGALQHGGVAGDATLLRFLHDHSSPRLDSIMRFVTELGRLRVLGPATVVIVAELFRRHQPRNALFVGLAMGGAHQLTIAAKLLFRRDRPMLWQSIAPETSFSYPSGHAMGSMAFGLALAVVCWSTRLRWPAVVFGALFASLVGTSRVYLGVHYPTDVLGGWLAGFAWVTALALLLLPRRFSPRH